jgi:hypothetical protein
MTEFTLAAPLANSDGVEPTGFFEQLALALGKMTGAMVSDGHYVDIGASSMDLISLQAIFSQAGVEALVMGAAPSSDEKSAFVAVTDGSIIRVLSTIKDGNLSIVGYKAEVSECLKDCSIVQEYVNGIKSIVAEALRAGGFAEEDDQCNGHVKVNCHAAICLRVSGKGKFIISKGKTLEVRGGWDYEVDCPHPNADVDTVLASLKVRAMDAEEIEAERNLQKEALGIVNPFHVKVGEA